ncbi:MAG: hypothetical protein K8R59_07695 [Thermoanaerobaculales bacterium]|nr:hypothetical protein [Thermoanaerobaculales bacterium]
MKVLNRMLVTGLTAGMMVTAPLCVEADDPEPTPSPAPTEVSVKRPKTLSDLARGFTLQQLEGKTDGGVVINNANLKAMGEGAVISEGKSLDSSGPVRRAGGLGSDSDASMKTSREVEQLREKVRNFESQKKALDDAAKERDKTNMYTGAGPQYRAPGVADPVDLQRRKIDRELDIARKNLNAAERKAQRRGPSPTQPEPPPTGDD